MSNKTILKLALAAGGCILFAWLLLNLAAVGQFFGAIWGILFPFILGFIIAFLLNIPMSALERTLLKRLGGKKRRVIGFCLTIVLVLAFLAFVTFLVIPQLVSTLTLLARAMPGYLRSWENYLRPYLEYLPAVQEWITGLDVDWQTLLRQAAAWLSSGAGNMLSSLYGMASSILGGVFTFLIGFVFSCYLLLDKEHLAAQFEGLLRAYLPGAVYNKLLGLGRLVGRTYSRFIGGQITEAGIVGAIYVIALSVGQFQYSLLIGVVMGLSTLIPLIGAYLGGILGAFFILVSMGLWRTVAFIILVLIILQLDANLIYPHVVGSSVGLPPVWILIAVILGGGLAGIFGALFFIPLFSVVHTLARQHALSRLAKKGIPSPVDALPKTPKKPNKKQ